MCFGTSPPSQPSLVGTWKKLPGTTVTSWQIAKREAWSKEREITDEPGTRCSKVERKAPKRSKANAKTSNRNIDDNGHRNADSAKARTEANKAATGSKDSKAADTSNRQAQAESTS